MAVSAIPIGLIFWYIYTGNSRHCMLSFELGLLPTTPVSVYVLDLMNKLRICALCALQSYNLYKVSLLMLELS